VLAAWLREQRPGADPAEVREVLSSNLCRCTGYGPIVKAVSAP
jgi:xanthine dehydrogenase iron-sulfur cluster and FAD-binding subunit A